MPGSLTTPSRPGARADAPECVAFHHMHGVGTQNRKLSRLNGWPMPTPVNASPRPSRATAHDWGPMWIATPSSQGTCTLYSLRSPGASHVPFRKTIGDQLTNGLDHERFGGIGMEEQGDRIGCRLSVTRPPPPRLCVECGERKHSMKHPFCRRQPAMRTIEAIGMRPGVGHSECCFQTEKCSVLERTPERQVDAHAANGLVMTIFQN
jgi:hypothetical protein